MARRRRAVERASLRQLIADRIIIVLLAVVAASGLMSLLPGSSQAAVSRFACQVGSLGLSSCTRNTLALGTEHLTPPRCTVLAGLDGVLPEVRVTQLTATGGFPVEIDSARSGRATITVGGPDDADPPLLLDGEARAQRAILPGAAVPSQTEWTLPSDQGVDSIVDSLTDAHQQWLQQRSPLAVLENVLHPAGSTVPEPNVHYTRVRLDTAVLPHTTVADPMPTGPASKNFAAVAAGVPATVQYDRTADQVSVVADLYGVVAKRPIRGSVRWTRDADGAVRNVLVAITSSGSLVRSEPRAAAGSVGSVGVAYLAVPIETAPEQLLAQSWLSDPAGFRIDLDQLLRLSAPDPKDRLTAFLTRAASVSTLRYAGLDETTVATRVREELVRLRRTDWSDAQLVAAGRVDPQPGGTPRTLVMDPTCTP